MENAKHKIFTSIKQLPVRMNIFKLHFDFKRIVYQSITFGCLILIWYYVARSFNNELLLPTPWKTFKALFFALQDMEVLGNLLLTLKRVMIGLGIALVLGLSLGFAMGYVNIINRLIDPIIGPIRQVPIMAWVPLTIVWFGLGDGPTLFLIAMVGIFPILLNTIAGVQSVPKNYYDAARSMGAGRFSMFKRITFPSALPDMITGIRIGLSAGWMSVI
jgi:ABC-type nitrate/sulfonate/bicarbonate transport system permease component